MHTLTIAPLKDQEDCSTFSCGNLDDHNKLNRFLQERALSHQKDLIGTTFLVKHNNKNVAYITLLADALKVEQGKKKGFFDAVFMKNKYNCYPALKIGRLAVDKDYSYNGNNRGLHIGTYLFNVAVGFAIKLNNTIGIRFIVVDSKNISKKWYLTKLKFRVLDDKDSNYLYYDLRGWKD